MNYNFSTLNDKEFEQICRDLLNAEFKLGLQAFKVGKDGGIDLRRSTANFKNDIVVQAKHYIGSGFAQLKHVLLKPETKDNITQLSPQRYIVCTSLALSVKEKDILKAGLEPYIQTANDVFSQDDLNELLIKHPEIERKYFKLWFSSIEVLNAVLYNAIEGRTKYHLQQIEKKIKFYVITKKLDQALSTLQKKKLLLITGQPGIGKTTLADIILFERAKRGMNIYKIENIREAEDVISVNDEEKQVFYFDDFLGANYFEIVNAQKTETQLTSFVERIKNTPNKYLILTTRTIILNQASERYEKIGQSRLSNQQFEIKLTDYSKLEKAQILYNHLYFRKIDQSLYESILNEKFYKKIISHKNYTPRIIEFITDHSRIAGLSPSSYQQYILNNLNNPKEIWRYSFNNQIEYLDRCLLTTLFTFDGNGYQTSLRAAFEKRLAYEKSEHNQIIESNQFENSIKILLNGFITSVLHDTTPPIRHYQFINPSLADFLIGYLAESYTERKSVVTSLKYIEQLDRFNSEKSPIPFEKELQLMIRNMIAKNQLSILYTTKDFTENKRNAIILETLCRYCSDVNFDNIAIKHFQLIGYESPWLSIVERIIYFLVHLNDAPETQAYITANFKRIIDQVIKSIDDENQAKKIPEIFAHYEIDFEEYSEEKSGNKNLMHLVGSVLRTKENDLKVQNRKEVKDFDDVNYMIYDELDSIKSSLLNTLFPYTHIDYDFGIAIDENYWTEQIDYNLASEEEAAGDEYDYYSDAMAERASEDKMIDDLFEQE
ncbi:restriction endonuclease [Mucilaginibacter sp. L3T2-6]|uniref:nSTAND3 domain-containing NTPase n=1 Tax=Mucilaginibacter sp. L3T2-6 TaxID=3062491 RepID=UPI0026744B0C|nr:restriction endonuclease [Mucilaginibacter sp. L3T2-6]MDO3641566.1 restriction endonuclease [Mucilaginibacter sp. L3T2-6]MDV6214060.1 restriction endonuclease [Mucilaginibacter sp. L3T2-6]